MEDEVERPDGNADHNQHIRQRTRLDVHLVGDDWHGNQQTITNQPAEHAQTQRPVSGAAIPNSERAKIRHAWAKYQPQQRLKELNYGEGIQKQRLLEGDSFVAGIQPVGQQLPCKQRQRQQQ